MPFWDRFRRTAVTTQLAASELVYMMTPTPGGGFKMQAVKSGGYLGGAYSPYNNAPITSSPAGYAYASIVSVWAMRCIEIRSKAVSRMDWYVKSRKTGKKIDNHPLEVALQRSPQRIMRKWEWSQMVWGETFLWPRRNDDSYYSDIKWLNNLGVEVDTSTGTIRQFQYTPTYGGTAHNFKPSQIAYFYTDNPFDDLRGLSKFESVLLEVGIDKDITRVTKAFYANDTRVGLMLIPENDLNVTDAKAFIEFWKDNFQGPANAGKPVLMPHNIKEVKEIQRAPTPDDVELRESTRREICAAFGVPMSIAGAWDDANYQSAPEQRKSLYEETVIPECEDIARDGTQRLLPFFGNPETEEIDFDATKIMALIENQDEKANIANARLTSGGITLNEYREQMELEPIPQGNVYYIPSNARVIPASQLGQVGNEPEPQRMQIETPRMTPPPQPQLPAPPPEPTKHVHEDVIDVELDFDDDNRLAELDAWERFATNRIGKSNSRLFEPVLTRGDLGDWLLEAVPACADKDAVKALFNQARERVAVKAIQATRLDFETDFEDLLRAARKGDLDRRGWAARVRRDLRKYGEQAFRDGLEDGGVVLEPGEPLSSEDAATVAELAASQSQYVTELGSVLFRDDGISNDQASLKPTQWFNKSVMPFYDAAGVSADRNAMKEFAGNDGAESCATCTRLKGQRHRYKDWARKEFLPPYGAHLDCADGGLCQHQLVTVFGKARGNW